MEITIYTLSWCSHCKELKKYLLESKLNFKDVDVEENHEEAKKIIEKTGQSAFPVIDIDGKILIGFDREKIEKTLKSI